MEAEILMVKEEVLVVKEDILTAMEEIITKENVVKAVVKAVVKVVVKVVAENSIMEEDIMKAVFMKEDMDSIVVHPIAIGRMC